MYYRFIEYTCAECKRVFIPAPYHAYKDGRKLFCRYNCYMAYFKRKEQGKAAKKKENGNLLFKNGLYAPSNKKGGK